METDRPWLKAGSDMSRSHWLRSDRGPVRDTLFGDPVDSNPMEWERPASPMSWRVRAVMERYLKPNHAKALEDRFFAQKSLGEMADERGVTRHAVSALVQRAIDNFVAAFGGHIHEVLEVPESEL